MSDNHNFLALDWVKSEIEETLKQAQQALEAYVANPSDAAKLRFCLAYLHQVFGTLQMVEFYGAALLAEEMEKLCLSLVNNKVSNPKAAQQALVDAMLQLPAYLERLQVAKRDTPFVLLPTINSMRLAHDETPLSELALFKPDFTRVFSILGQTGIAPAPVTLKKLRQGYQVSLLGIIRQQNLGQNFAQLLMVLDKLGLFMGQKALQALWQVASALVEGLMHNSIPLTPAVKTLLGEVERELRKFAAYPQHSPALDLLKNILYYLAKSRGNSQRVLAMRALYRLDDALPTFDVVEAEKEKLAAPDRQALQSVIKGVSDELARVKEAIDDLTYADRPDIKALQPLIPTLKQVASTLQVMGLQHLQKNIADQAKTLTRAVNLGVLPEGALLVVASALLEVESGLQQLVENQPLAAIGDPYGGSAMVDQVSAAQGAVLRESRTALEKAKECIVEYISSQWDAERLSELPMLLATVRGGLTMLDLTRPAQILSRLSEFIQQHLLKDDYRPSWSEMDTLADIISSVEYYLERVANHHQNNSLLDLAAQSLDKLGFGLVLVPPPEPVERRTEAKSDEEKALPAVVFEGDFDDESEETSKTLINMPALVLPEAVEAFAADESFGADQAFEADETAAQAPAVDLDKTQISMPALVLPDDTMAAETVVEDAMAEVAPAVDLDKTQISMPALNLPEPRDVMPDDLGKTQISMPALVLPEAPASADADDNLFGSTLTFDAEALLGNMTFAPKPAPIAPAMPSPAPAEGLTRFDDTESLFRPADVDMDATLTSMPVPAELALPADADDADATVIAESETDAVAQAPVAEDTLAIATEETPAPEVVEAVDADATVELVAEPAPVAVESAEPSEPEPAAPVAAVRAPSRPALEITAVVPEDDFSEDDEIREIFIEEAEEVLETITTYLPKWAANFDNKSALTEVRRGFHTLKGSGRMVGAKVVAELAWSIENMLNRVIDKTTQPNAVMMTLIGEVVNVTPGLITNFNDKAAPGLNTAPLMTMADLFAKAKGPDSDTLELAFAYARGDVPAEDDAAEERVGDAIAGVEPEVVETAVEPVAVVAEPQEPAPASETVAATPAVSVAQTVAADEDDVADTVYFDSDLMDEDFAVPMDLGEETDPVPEAHSAVPAEEATPATPVAPAAIEVAQHIPVPVDDFDQDDEIREIFIEEVEEVLETIHDSFPKWAANFGNSAALTEFRRGFHTLKGSGRMVGAKVEAELAWSIENMLNRVIDKTTKPNAEMVRLITEVLNLIPELISNFQDKKTPVLNTSPLMSLADFFARAKPVSFADIDAAIECTHGRTPVAPAAGEAVAQAPAVATLAAPAASAPAEDNEDLSDAFEELAASLADLPAAAPAPAAAAQEHSLAHDPVLLDIFITEATSYLDEISAYVDGLPAQYKSVPVTDQMLRALHTLRGSAGMAGVKTVASVAAPMEQLFKDLRMQNRGLHHKHIDLLDQAQRLIRQSITDVAAGGSGFLAEGAAFIEKISQVAHAPMSADDDHPVEATAPVNTAGLVAGFMDLGLDHLLDAPWELTGWLTGVDRAERIQDLRRELDLLAPAAAKSGIQPLADVTAQLGCVYRFIAEEPDQALANDQLLEDLGNAHDEIINIFDTLAACQTVAPNPRLLEGLREWGGSPVATPEAAPAPVAAPAPAPYTPAVAEIDTGADPELLAIFLEEAEEVLTAADDELANWRNNTEDKQPLRVLQRHLHTLKGGARMAVVASLGDLGHELEFLYEDLVNNRYQATQVLIDLLQRCHDRLAEMIEDLQQTGQCKFAKDLVEVIDLYRHKPSDAVILDFFSPAAGGSTEAGNNASVPSAAAPEIEIAAASVTVEPAPAVAAPAAPETADETLDPELLEIFLDEAQEIIEQVNTSLQEWMQNPEDTKPVQILQRGLHTLKGGARMSGVNSMGDLAHEMENIYEGVCQKRYQGGPEVFSVLQRCHDRIADGIDLLKDQGKSLAVTDLVEQLKQYLASPATFKDVVAAPAAPAPAPQPAPAAAKTAVVEAAPVELKPALAAGVMPSMNGNFRKSGSAQQTAQEMIRVSSELMEKLINLAGETSIIRSRVEMGVHSFTQTVEEMGATVQRLLDQLRRMEGELEVQILAKHTQEGGKYEDFDPLEMDEYSSLNQLSKSLSESASDLLDIKSTMLDKARDTETLLLQQSRLNTELQEGLMSSRMVPFSRLVPRLQRIVRQTSTELHKPAELNVVNAEGEMDRTLLERIVAPLEHMLRNAVDHGLEPPADRAASGKAPMGHITLSIGREGGEIVLTLADDGRGVNVDAVRRKAIERGLLDADADISEKELLQFLFHAGFSTAQKVTQISGRGVGMDVVQSEIKQLGGTIVINSVAGKGTTFVMRLPFTVAVSRALMVRIGEDVYAIPLSQIEGIVRASPYELETYYAPDAPPFEYAGMGYKLHYLGEFVHGIRTPSLFGQTLPLPIMLIRGAEKQVAIQVDQLIGSREIVVKSVGSQLASVAGISGATILGDGSVVIILDTVAMLRAAALQKPRQLSETSGPATPAKAERSTRTVMVVDDSVTVRKVTSRLLERHGYEVVLAKDGLDAITKLEDIRPDIMLLDIEMPRMDGFEVASLVRHNPNLTGLPIIMITSRTGEKHRERAFQIGVNAYMGKPFQEQQLLETIAELLAAVAAR